MIKTGEDNLRHLHYQQTVEFTGQENQHSVELYGTNITVIPSPGGHNHGSSKVKLKNIVDFTWEHNFYPGQLLAVHMSGKYLAYGIKVGNGGGMVRVVYKELEQRALLRGMRAAIQDLAFAHVSNAILACVDYLGNLFIHTIESTPSELLCSLLLQVNAEDISPTSHRVIWCPYIPEDVPSDGDRVSKLLVLTRGSKVELWSVNTVSARFRSIEATDPAVKENGGMLEIDQHSDTIIEATFSPDGTALATASFDGEVKFFQVYLHSNSHGNQAQPRCLHQWRPHGGRPISCLFFLDDHKTYHPEVQFWRFAITGCDNNTELKVWSCEVWSCLQTIKFAPTPSTGKLPVLKAGLDLSAGYLLLSDIYNKVLYILSLIKDNGDTLTSVSTISEFLLPYPILSFGIVDAGLCKVRPTGESLEDLSPCEDDIEEQLVIRMYLVQPKSLQECHIAFKPASHVSGNCLMDTLTHDSLGFSEDLPDMGNVNHNGISGENCEENCSLSATIEATTNHNTGLNLMTPDAFSSPAKKENNELDSRPSSPELGKVLSASPSLAQAVQALNATDPPLATSELEEQAPASSGSSPSREVREILSLTKANEEPETENKPEITNTVDEDWPNIPMVLLKDVSRHAMQETDGFTNEEEKRKKIKDESTIAENDETTWQTTSKLNALELINKIESILEVVQNQRQELRELRTEMTRLRQETPISTRIESALARASQQQNATLEQTLYSQMARQHEFLKTLETTIKDKIETTLPRIIEDTVEPLKHQLRLDSARMDELLKKNLTDLINSSHIKDTLAVAAVNAAKPALDAAFKEAFTNVLLPGMEKACQTMFRQVQDVFIRGTREYLQNVDAIADKQYQQRNEQQSEALSALVREELQTELNRGLIILQEGTIRTIRDSIRDNLNQQLTEITNARSRATTPAIPVSAVADAQARVISLLQRGQLNAAFQQALSASDLGLVVLVCEKTEPARVFSSVGPQGQGTRCILQQPVILSLVQQLSADLGHRTELKHRWLEEAILNLDPNDPVTREHMGTVLMTLQTQLAAFVAANPNHSSTRRMKMLAMAARALLNQQP
ncbi:enhancer of mRNA-decapping protein 4 [Apis mellifera caucasica]|uniref:Enhancer of mRNA-decapping protein 4 n=1 Tax=Apis mellifera TaxID=7460 RepID=A0A7M7TFF5_APIME|nr:enhancer of mRNA-decapping protein 4 [Apis mellifera]KAG6802398.1 enhancer of mRNA-decapping protein 4 [Apis mellifera caucasica]KAG9437895.1 enhancer of mRNA-decapping protein 4 [Apis mellifera carnica]|eukprot:XP_396550.2 enhancer of mRNA-decapping protein 4 [Apis mellifera]